MRELTSGVARVDDTDSAGHTVGTGLLDGPLQLLHVQGPLVLLIQVVRDLDSTNWFIITAYL